MLCADRSVPLFPFLLQFEGVNQYTPMLDAARQLRLEHERQEQMETQLADQTQQASLLPGHGPELAARCS
jgi:hypothetical protein